MRFRLLIGVFLPLAAFAAQPSPSPVPVQVVATFPNRQVTGVAVGRSGRIFVNFPDWGERNGISVAEVVNGEPQPFPNAEWNQRGDPATHFICVQAVYTDELDCLWILDPASPKMEGTTPGGPKLVKVDLAGNKVVQNIPFGSDIAPKKSYLNDVRVDNARQIAYLTDSGLGALVVVDLKTGKARRCLAHDASTKGEPGLKLIVDGKELIDQKTGQPPTINSDGIALDTANGWLYYHALTAHTLYRVKTSDLNDPALSEKELSSRVQAVAQTAAADGMLEAKDGSIYLTDLEHHAVSRFDPATKTLSQVAADRRLQWPDTMSWGPDGSLYVSASQIENMPRFNGGKSTRTEPYQVFRISPPRMSQ